MAYLRPFALLGLAALLFAATGCDSNNPGDSVSPQDVQGIYDFTEYRFDPDAGGITDAVVLDTLVARNTFVELFGSGQADFRYQFEGGPTDRISGSFTLNRERIRLSFTGAESRLAPLLLSNTVTFDRESGNVLALEEDVTVNLEAFDADEYDGLTAVRGTLNITLRRRAE